MIGWRCCRNFWCLADQLAHLVGLHIDWLCDRHEHIITRGDQ